MNYSQLKRLAAVSAVALVLAFGAQPANAQVNADVGALFATAAALSAADGTDMDFGTWVANIQSAETPTLVLTSLVAGVPPVPTIGGVTNSVVVNTVAPASSGTVVVTSPIATDLEIQGSVTTPFGEANLSLGSLTFTDIDTPDDPLPAAFDGTVVSAIAGDTTIGIGGTLTILDNVAEGATFTDAVVQVGFRY